MHTNLDCYPCFLRQALSAARRAAATPELQRGILLETLERLRALPPEATPPMMADDIHRLVRTRTENPDPYREAKAEATREALALLPVLREHVGRAADPLDIAVRIAIAGNIIDLGAAETYDLDETLARVLAEPLAIDGLEALRHALGSAKAVLYLADNAGETVFDRVLIEHLDRPVTYVVKGGPIINDATREDALAAGIDRIAVIIDNGSQAPGTVLEHCAESFLERFAEAELIIAKGQANYETLSTVSAPVFFLLQAKCAVIAADLGVAPGALVVKGPTSS
ncbi:MAG: DUF89 family protein [Sphingobacteriia bacterium]|nr:DUF89 family protein [Sphingobacteriia bacterium]